MRSSHRCCGHYTSYIAGTSTTYQTEGSVRESEVAPGPGARVYLGECRESNKDCEAADVAGGDGTFEHARFEPHQAGKTDDEIGADTSYLEITLEIYLRGGDYVNISPVRGSRCPRQPLISDQEPTESGNTGH